MPRSTHTFKKSTSPSYKSNQVTDYKSNQITDYKPTHVPMISQSPTMFDSMKQGFGFGVGSSIAHYFFDYKPIIHQKIDLEKNSCNIFSEHLTRCKIECFCSDDFIKSLEDNLKKCEYK